MLGLGHKLERSVDLLLLRTLHLRHQFPEGTQYRGEAESRHVFECQRGCLRFFVLTEPVYWWRVEVTSSAAPASNTRKTEGTGQFSILLMSRGWAAKRKMVATCRGDWVPRQGDVDVGTAARQENDMADTGKKSKNFAGR